MPVNRRAKIWLLILTIPVVLLIAGVIVLKVMFTSERLKSMVIPAAEETTGRKVSIDDMSLAVFPTIALKLEGVTVSNRQEEGFSPEPFLALEALRLNVKLIPLLKSKLEVTSLEVERPRLLLEVNAAEESNYSNLTTGGKPPEAGPEKTPESSMALAIMVSSLQVNNGSVKYINHKDNSAASAGNLSLDMGVEGEGNTYIVAGTATTDSLKYGTIETPLLSGLRLGLNHRILYDASKDELTIERGDLTLQDIQLGITGTVTGVTATPVLDLSIGSDNLNIADLFSLIPGEYRKKAQGAKGTGIAQVHIAVTGALTDSTTPDITGRVTARDASIQYPDLPKPITDITVLSNFTSTKTKQEVRIEDLTASLGGTPIRMAMTVVNFDDPTLDLTASGKLNLATLPEYYPLEKGTELGGEVSLDLRLAGKASNPNALRAEGSLVLRDVSAKTATTTNPVRKLNGTVSFSNEVAESKQLSMVIGKSDMTLAWRVKNYLSLLSTDKKAPRTTATVGLQSNHFYVRDIMSEEEGSGTNTPPAKKSAFALPDLDMDVNASIGTLTLEKFEFTAVRGSLRISNGVITMQNLSLNSFGGSVVSTGSLNLASPAQPLFDLKLNVNAVQASSLLSPFTSFGQRLNGALTMSTNLKGALDDTLGLVPDRLQGGGTVSVKEGSLTGVKVNQSLASMLNLPDLAMIQFKDWGNDFTVENGRLVIKELTITALNSQYVVSGSQGLDGSLDYRLALYLPESAASKITVPGFAGEAVNLFKDQSGRLRLDFNVGGTMDAPKLALDTAPVQKKAEDMARKKLDEEKKKLEDQLKKKTQDALKNLFKK